MTIDETTQLLNEAFAAAPTPLVFVYSNGNWTANGGPFPAVFNSSGWWLARAAESGPLCAAEAPDRAVRDALHAHGVASRLPDAKLAAAHHALRVEDETLRAQLRDVTEERDAAQYLAERRGADLDVLRAQLRNVTAQRDELREAADGMLRTAPIPTDYRLMLLMSSATPETNPALFDGVDRYELARAALATALEAAR